MAGKFLDLHTLATSGNCANVVSPFFETISDIAYEKHTLTTYFLSLRRSSGLLRGPRNQFDEKIAKTIGSALGSSNQCDEKIAIKKRTALGSRN